MQLVTRSQFDQVVGSLAQEPELAVDTETTGLRVFQEDRLFSIIIATAHAEYYFNFQTYPGVPDEQVLPREWIPRMQPLFDSTAGWLDAHNAKFDWHFLAQEGIEIHRRVWCTEALARVEHNEHLQYSLDACLKRIGLEKDDAVEKWIDDNHAWEWQSRPGKKTRTKKKFFDRVPLDISVPYGCKDARGCFDLAQSQRKRFYELDATHVGAPPIWQVAKNEIAFTRVAYHMEKDGILIDRAYCTTAHEFEVDRAQTAAVEFHTLTGEPLVDSAPGLRDILKSVGVTPGKTEAGRDSFDEDSLIKFKTNPVVQQILLHRDALKRANTYFSNYLTLADRHDRIHVNLRQAGTATGRASASDPNLQNVNAEDESPYPVRRVFIPDAGGFFGSVDYSQAEYRLMLDYAMEMAVIEKILGGMDVHEACAQLMGVPRSQAKNINFALLYGAGVDKLAAMLRVDRAEALRLRAIYFESLPMVKHFIRKVIKTAETRGYLWNWFGRRCTFTNPQFAYKAPNYLIQGGCADIMKLAMINVTEKVLPGKKTKLLLNIHDEGLFWVPDSERSILVDIAQEMKQAYPYKKLPQDCSISSSYRSWHDLEDFVA